VEVSVEIGGAGNPGPPGRRAKKTAETFFPPVLLDLLFSSLLCLEIYLYPLYL
jgi:hypothetical protein